MGRFVLKEKLSLPKLNQVVTLHRIKKELKKKLKEVKLNKQESPLSEQDQILIRSIRERTERQNMNNVTRTMAYLDYYQRHPEIRWALLGHVVSRNGGWNMTDLKGELLSRLLSEREQQDFFHFLERGNWLIFQDVYPQLLLYEESLKRKSNLFDLLAHLNVSIFMEVTWNHFWLYGNRDILATALVINEQSYLEKRVIQNPVFQEKVLDTFEFKMQELLSLNQILIPYLNEKSAGAGQKTKLTGLTLHLFASLHQRIMLGKRLYGLLFGNADLLQGVIGWAMRHPHTGSRKDYWPHLFHDVNLSVPGTPYKRRTADCQLRAGAERLYSPALQHAWKDIEHHEAENGDWFTDWKIASYLLTREQNITGEIEHEYCKTLEKIELAVMAKTAVV
jgi:hypothetical protein